jgi:pimeloyl-ACP methyl ester carboxylesterase
MTDQGPRGSDAGAGGWVIESEGTGPGLLCLHGMGGAALWFKGLAVRLRNRHRVMAMDLPGTGRNRAGHSPFSVERCVEAVLRIAERESSPVSLLGHSLGTIIALKAFAAAPRLFRSLIFVGGLPAVNPAMRVRLAQRRLRIQAEGMAGIGWSAASGVFARATLEEQPEIAAQYARAFEAIPAQEYLEVLDALLAADAAHAVPSAAAPSLVLTGSEDAYAPPEDSRLFLSTLPGARRGVEIRDCGHMPFLERPEAFSSEIANFLTLHDASQKT